MAKVVCVQPFSDIVMVDSCDSDNMVDVQEYSGMVVACVARESFINSKLRKQLLPGWGRSCFVKALWVRRIATTAKTGAGRVPESVTAKSRGGVLTDRPGGPTGTS